MTREVLRIAVGLRFGTPLCKPHTYKYGVIPEPNGHNRFS